MDRRFFVAEPEGGVQAVAGEVALRDDQVGARGGDVGVGDPALGVGVLVERVLRFAEAAFDRRFFDPGRRDQVQADVREQQFGDLGAAPGEDHGDVDLDLPGRQVDLPVARDRHPAVLVRFAPEEVRVGDPDHRREQEREQEEGADPEQDAAGGRLDLADPAHEERSLRPPRPVRIDEGH